MPTQSINPDASGYYGEYGGMFIPEILRTTFDELIAAFNEAKSDPGFWQSYLDVMQNYSCRPTPITHLENFAEVLGGKFDVFCKREDLNHTGAHKANNCMGQGLLVQRMGKKRVIAETGAGQHGVATATMAARMGLECTVYMGAVDVERQRPNVFWMEQLGATVVSVTEGTATLKDAINAAMRDWAESMETTHYVLGTTCGPHPFPEMVSWFQSIIGQESRQQMLKINGKLPDKIYACVGGGSNASGIFLPFLEDKDVELVGVEAVIDKDHTSALLANKLGVDCLVILTEVEYVFLNYNSPTPEPIHQVSVKVMEKYLQAGEFAEGSMKPKVEAVLKFLKSGGKRAIIAGLFNLARAVEGQSGTHILVD